ncbi:cell division protein ZapA [Vagococcus elongatus]|uniref:cell division protein ZapA n=1 Tax=Vagococcus elongatus TaxID=180344 RepID=UPI0014769949|nr:cell division protein ZapA [Vagococcus elongatus]
MNKTRYKAEIAGQTYTIIGSESKPHMDAVVSLANKQLNQLKNAAPETTEEQSAVLLAINALSDQLHMQEEINGLTEKLETFEAEVEKLKDSHRKVKELEARLSRYEELERKAKQTLKEDGRQIEELSPGEVQTIMNQQSLEKIQKRNNPK